MTLYELLGATAETAINTWVRVLGTTIDPREHTWLRCPIGAPNLVGGEIYRDIAEREGLDLRAAQTTGLLKRFDDLASDRFDAAKIDPRIRDFYERTASYDLEVWSEVGALWRPFLWGLVKFVSRRMDQLVFPMSALELSGGMKNEVIELVDRATQQRAYCGWRRTLVNSGSIIYAGLYSTVVPPGYGRPCVKVTFPVRRGSAGVVLRPEVEADGSLRLIAEGEKFGDPGFYRIVELSDNRWAVRYIPRLREAFHVYVHADGLPRTEHIIRILGAPVLRLHYKMRKASAAPAQMAASHSNSGV
jgi:hypothetical protein